MFNFLLWLGGAFLLGVGIWMKVDPTIVNYLEVVNVDKSDPLLHYAAWVLMISGAVSFFIGIVGCCGAMREHQGLLFLYAVLLVIIMIAEIAAAIIALYYRSQIENSLASGMQKQITQNFVTNSSTYFAWNFLQQEMKCCGANNFTDYVNSVWWNTSRVKINNTQQYIPDSCCTSWGSNAKNPQVVNWVGCQKDASYLNTNSVNFYTKGCLNSVNDWINGHSLLLILIGFGVGFSQLLGCIIAICLRKSIKEEAKIV